MDDTKNRADELDSQYSKTVLAAFELLEAFNDETTELGVRELSRQVGRPKSSVSRLVSTLHYLGVLEQDRASGKYRIGAKLFELGMLWLHNIPARERIQKHLQQLVERTEETAYLAVLNGEETAIYLDKVQSPRAVRVGSPVGRPVSLAASAIGRALLAYLPPDQRARVLRNYHPTKRTPNTITDLETLQRFLQESKACGYFLDDEEAEIGLRCIAAPILAHDGSLLASICISGPTTRITYERVPALASAVKEVAEAAAKELEPLREHGSFLT